MDPILLLFIGLAAFVIFRLISVLGERTGHEQQHDVEGLQRAAHGDGPEPKQGEDRDAPIDEAAVASAISPAAKALRDAAPDFDEQDYLAGARAAYEMIVEAFAAGDLKSIRPFLNEDVYSAFKAAIESRERAARQSELKFIGIDRATIAHSEVRDGAMYATTDFSSNQVRITRDASGAVVDGDPNRIDLVKDRWTFSRALASRDPNWILVATSAA